MRVGGGFEFWGGSVRWVVVEYGMMFLVVLFDFF